MSELERSVRDLIARYVAGMITLAALGQVLPDGWDLDAADEPEAKRLVLLTVGCISDYERGNLPESEVRGRLSAEASWHLERASTVVSPPPLEPGPVETHVRADTKPQEVLAS